MKEINCGTHGGYQTHKKRGETPCDDCRLAHNAYKQNWKLENPEKVKASRDKHYNAYPDRAIARTRKRKSLKLNVLTEEYSASDVLDRYGTDCHICHDPIDLDAPRYQGHVNWQLGLQIDHVIPLSKGGEDVMDNVRPAHGICNIRKRDYDFEVSE